MYSSLVFISALVTSNIFRVQCAPVTIVPSSPTLPSSNIPPPEAINFMKRFGYLDPGVPLAESLYTEEAIVNAIKTMQKFGEISETGQLDEATIKLMQARRCGVPDIVRKKSKRMKRYIIGSEGWKKRRITYFVANWSPKIGEVAVVQEIQRAFDSWSGYSQLTFQHVQDPNADIIVAFGRGPHGDGYPFDGPGNTLAHAFYPYEMGRYGGDIHFDDDENWEVHPHENENSVDFFTVAVHELGHSLGLAHSPVSSSIMFPYYKGYQPTFQLAYDDILAMYELYISRSLQGDNEIHVEDHDGQVGDDDDQDTPDHEGKDPDHTPSNDDNDYNYDDQENTSDDRRTDGKFPEYTDEVESSSGDSSSSFPSTTPKHDNVTYVGDDESVDDHIQHDTTYGQPISPSPLDICNGSYDAISVLRSELFVFKNKHVWRLSNRNKVQSGYPVPFRQLFWKFPESVTKIDCIYERESDQHIILFTGNMYWVFNGDDFTDESPQPITDYGLPSDLDHIDACMVWNKNGKTFLFSGDLYWRYNDTTQKMDPGYPHNIARWRGVPSHLDAAMTWTDGLTYFFKDDLFWQFNNRLIKTESNDPRQASTYWLGC